MKPFNHLIQAFLILLTAALTSLVWYSDFKLLGDRYKDSQTQLYLLTQASDHFQIELDHLKLVNQELSSLLEARSPVCVAK